MTATILSGSTRSVQGRSSSRRCWSSAHSSAVSSSLSFRSMRCSRLSTEAEAYPPTLRHPR
ncbi:hypothetical protein AMJ39_09065 [candidate division TA06 bacterium DG_24]|uniref:Uncharacterized protein n=2 Tax=Bacteria division TA06 TaxID=1156500 RepID=A0A0S8JLH2_UNCT6|nr:MAG: hypothetical protein AMJ39_09065 [candidate division TA06 bacterium DG_24]KPL09483.1 MAG: hypothetical protein AMJ71_06325 [candidate division TA06 bacterium SM1_40]